MHRIEQLRCELLKQGCPLAMLQRMVQEVSDHGEDLHQAALAEGLSATDAEARAQAQLGEPVVLAERLMASLVRSSWCGRHPVMSFCLLPLLLAPMICTLSILLGFWLELTISYGGHLDKVRNVINQPEKLYGFVWSVYTANYVAIALVPIICCWLARRSALGFQWALAACVLCSLHALLYHVIIVPHRLGFSYIDYHYRLTNWIAAVIPCLVMAATYAWQQRFRENIPGAKSVAG